MATQRITVAKIGGLAAEVIEQRLCEWASARQAADPREWAPEQWPPDVRCRADEFVEQLRRHALCPPVVHFVEWSDLWSMGDLFRRWLAPQGGRAALMVETDRFEIYGYGLPDGDRLGRHLASAGLQQFEEYDRYVTRLREALTAWERLVDRAVLVVVREVAGGLVTDQEIAGSLAHLPDWLV